MARRYCKPSRYQRTGLDSLGADQRFPPDAAVEPAVPLMRPFGPVRQGTRTINLNRRNLLFWPTTGTVIEVIPDQKLAFRVNTNNTVWSYELEPIAEGTRVIESRHAENGQAGVERGGEHVLRRDRDFERELVDGMNASLAKIKAAAEDS